MTTTASSSPLEDLYAEASRLHAAGQNQEAEVQYRALLQALPTHPDALHRLGALLIQLHGPSKHEEGRALVQAAINQRPSCAKYRHSLGVLHQACGRHQEAVEAFERTIEKDPMNVQVRPRCADSALLNQTLLCLARSLRELGRNQRASEVYRSVTMLEPRHPKAHYQQGTCLREAGRTEAALACLRQHQRLFPEDEQARFWIAAMSGDTSAMQAMPADLVARLFDKYAPRFDEHLVTRLQYRTPQCLMDAILQASSSGSAGAGATHCSPHWQRAVDLGCGTGLMGPLLRPHVSLLEGADLSPAMVDKAREKGCYDRLAVAELVAYIEGRDDAGGASSKQGAVVAALYDLLVAADVFVYLGDLAPVMSSAARHSSTGALFAFSTESLESQGTGGTGSGSHGSGSQDATGYALTPSGRYAHSRQYLVALAGSTGWGVCHLSDQVIRHNAGQPVHGHLCVFELQAAAGSVEGQCS